MTKHRKYTKEMLAEAASNNYSTAGVLRFLGVKQSGGSHSHIKKMMIKLGVDITHFTSQAWNKGGTDPNRLSAKEILVVDRLEGCKTKTEQLRRALIEIGRKHQCERCKLGNEWNNERLVLHIDHISGDFLDNRAENLRFLCPNCHSQTPTYGKRKG